MATRPRVDKRRARPRPSHCSACAACATAPSAPDCIARAAHRPLPAAAPSQPDRCRRCRRMRRAACRGAAAPRSRPRCGGQHRAGRSALPAAEAAARGSDAGRRPHAGPVRRPVRSHARRLQARGRRRAHGDRRQLHWYASQSRLSAARLRARRAVPLPHRHASSRARGMPLELALLPVVESAFEPYAYSRARASGLWQFIPGTGTRFGLKQDWWYDGRRDIVESTRAALDYLQSLHDEFNGDWLLADRRLQLRRGAWSSAPSRRTATPGKPIDFWNLRLPRETRAYVPKLLAMKRLVAGPGGATAWRSARSRTSPTSRASTRGGQIDLQARRRDRRHHARGALRAESGVPSLGHRSRRAALPAAAGRGGRRVHGRTSRSSPPTSAWASRTTRCGAGDSVASVAKQFNTTVDVVRELNDMPTGALIGRATTCACRRRSPSCRPRSCWPRRWSTSRGRPRAVRTCSRAARRFAVDHRPPARHGRATRSP